MEEIFFFSDACHLNLFYAAGLARQRQTSVLCLNETPELGKDRACGLTAEDKFLSPIDTWLLSPQVDPEVDHNQLEQKYCCVTMTMTQPFDFILNSAERRVLYSNKNVTLSELHS